jgi:hypothetical protein
MKSPDLRVEDLGFRVYGPRILSTGVLGLKFKVWGSGVRVLGLMLMLEIESSGF